ncbi:Sulfotransferase domain-containing protein [Aliiruegeria lutimaris]|uniref:Sulfotransferase domain-containing protein n=2 Tax=Aliiruegeria lutimaris TaxID=571298 RepID=A0A1G9FYT1_9RHOB|nr:Sulfotransferase domain-containing protein [Aliiruegeria lutimaris]
MLRHPVARSYSIYLEVLKHYQNDSGTGQVNRSFEEFLFPERFPERAPRAKVFARFDAHLPDDPGLFLDGSDYALQAGEYLRHFPRDQVRFILFEEYVKDTVEHLASVLEFLGLDPYEAEIATAHEARNTSSDHFSRTAQQQQVADFKRRFVPAWVNDALPESWRARLRQALLSVNRATGVKAVLPPAMTVETRAELTAHFASRYEDIEQLTGLDLTPWREIDMRAG